ncbi:glutathione peroxidase, partial [Stenotrophomonas maltophilia]
MPLPTVMPRRLRGLSLLTLLVAGLAGSTHVLAA